MRPFCQIGFLFLLSFRLVAVGSAQSGIITTYAGPAMPVSGGLAVNQPIDGPVSVISDRAGGFYLTSEKQNRVYRVASDGKLSAVAGNGTRGFSGDGGPATSAQLFQPVSVAMDTAGNLFIADSLNSRIRKVTGGPTAFMDLNMSAGGVANSTTAGEGDEIQAGYASLTLRSLYNERGDFLITTFPIADANRAAPSPVIFPRIVDGGGYATQFILISSGGASSATINFYSETGAPLPVGNW